MNETAGSQCASGSEICTRRRLRLPRTTRWPCAILAVGAAGSGQCYKHSSPHPTSPHQSGAPLRCTAGFPVRSEPPPAMPDLIATQAQSMDGGDFSCSGSVEEGACAFHDVLAAAFRCSSVLAGACQSVVVYVNGTSGCQGSLLAVLKVCAPG